MYSGGVTNTQGIVVGCDLHQQWLLPWWWKNYSSHNSDPVLFVDFGMSKEALAWCQERGECATLPSTDLPLSLEKDVPSSTKAAWEERYGEGVWMRRRAWFKKPSSLLLSPFSLGIWIDVDCQVRGNVGPIFNSLIFGAEIALAKDRYEDADLSGEVIYNSGVIAFRQEAAILLKWQEIALLHEKELPGDQEALSRAIFQNKPALVVLPPIYNWRRTYGPNEEALIYHYSSGPGKIELMKNFSPETPIESLLLLQALKG